MGGKIAWVTQQPRGANTNAVVAAQAKSLVKRWNDLQRRKEKKLRIICGSYGRTKI